MSDFFTTALAFQSEILKAQRAQIDAAQGMLDMGRQMLSAGEDGQRSAEANLKAWRSWTALWGPK